MNEIILPKFKNQVSVIGDVMLDRYWSGPSTRVSPEAPVPVVQINKIEDRAGGAANVAINICSLGCQCNLIGLVGDDEACQKLKQIVSEKNVQPYFIKTSLPTITKLRVLSRNQQLLRLDFEDSYKDIDHGIFLQEIRKNIATSKVIICSDYGKGALQNISSIIKIANDANIPVLIDPKGTDFNKYKYATLLTPNLSEFEAVAGKVKDQDDLVEKAYKMIDDYSLKALLVTRSEDGMSLIRPGLEPLHLPTVAKEVYDVTGAGDTVIATLASCLASGCELDVACQIANIAAGVVVGKIGTSTVSIQELISAMSVNNYSHHSNIVDEDELLQIVLDLKDKNKKVVMTNGCFDIIHPGHIDYLSKAKALGDKLIVAVNSDASVKALKGPTRPINDLNSRMQILASLKSVDYVVAFNEQTPQRLISKILPDILVKGGDYTIDQIAGSKEVIANGGKVMTLGFVDGCSTSKIISKIKEQ